MLIIVSIAFLFAGFYMFYTKTVASFFSGCGGLDLGLEGGFPIHKNSIVPNDNDWIESSDGNDWVRLKKTGMKTVFACDIKKSAKICWENYFKRDNIFHLESIVDLVKKAKEDVFSFPYADIVTGGFPCQDFSVAGKRKGFSSHRDHNNILHDVPTVETRGMLYYWLREAISLIRPKIFIAENVKGLMSLEKAKDIISEDFRNINEGYYVATPQVLHAGNYGVPQSRERVFFIGIRKDLLSQELKKKLDSDLCSLYPKKSHNITHKHIVSVRHYLKDLDEPEESSDFSQKSFSKAKWYGRHCQGQTEVNLDGLAPTIRSEHHGNIEFRRLSSENGGKFLEEHNLTQRRLTVRECARIQTFPDNYNFVIPKHVSASEAYKLVGNAVPPLLAYHLAQHLSYIWEQLDHSQNMMVA